MKLENLWGGGRCVKILERGEKYFGCIPSHSMPRIDLLSFMPRNSFLYLLDAGTMQYPPHSLKFGGGSVLLDILLKLRVWKYSLEKYFESTFKITIVITCK